MRSIRSFFKIYCQLSKIGIVLFALLTAGLAYILSCQNFSSISWSQLSFFVLGFYMVCSAGFILNQVQERDWDRKMKRTQNRPIPLGKISPLQAYGLSLFFLLLGLWILFLLKPQTALLALLAVVLYNGFYTLFCKKFMKYGAVPGALPGALPPIIGWSLGESSIYSAPCAYLFLLLFLWQLPHFWSLSLHYKEDYKKAGWPMLAVLSARSKTLYYIGLYLLAYIGLALISPLFLPAGWLYMFLIVPLAFMLLYQFYKYMKNPTRWLKFFLWVNASIIVYFAVPVLDRWIFYYFTHWQVFHGT